MNASQNEAIISECKRQSESCLYTSTSLFEWAKAAKIQNAWWNALPIALGALASFGLLQNLYPSVAGILALVAGLVPSIYEKLSIEKHTEEMLLQAGQYKILQDKFTHTASITALDTDPEKLKFEYDALLSQLNDLRARPILVPEKYFKLAQDKIKAGHYDSDVNTA